MVMIQQKIYLQHQLFKQLHQQQGTFLKIHSVIISYFHLQKDLKVQVKRIPQYFDLELTLGRLIDRRVFSVNNEYYLVE